MSRRDPTTPYDTSAGSNPTRREGVRVHARGDPIGRYLVLEVLGSGGMGIVYRAYDPELDRELAVKLVHPRTHPSRPVHRDRLLREAQALARLRNPHVVTVYDVGTHDDGVFVAMELIEGRSLGDWLDQSPRGWREVLRVFVQAGRGLAAAHDAGMCHRDFKPANVLVGDDGGVRVVDFGLARMARQETGAPIASRHRLAEAARLTEGGFVGTPAYAAPEVRRGELGDVRSDQYSFCVALAEALGGVREEQPDGLAVITREASFPPAVPRALVRRIRRGVSEDPDARHSSMHVLLDALDSLPARKRRMAALVVGAASALGISVLALEPADACPSPDERLERLWPQPRRDRVADALSAAKSLESRQTEAIVSTLDVYFDRLVETGVQLCSSAAAASPDHGLAQACLDERLARVQSLVHVFEEAEPDVARHASSAVHDLPRISDCTDPTALRSQPDPPGPHEVERARELRRTLALVAALESAARYPEGLRLAHSANGRARSLRHGPLEAEAAHALGRLLERTGDYDEAIHQLERAYWTATEHHHDRVAAQSSTLLSFIRGVHLHGDDATQETIRRATAAVARLGEHTPETAELSNVLGVVAIRRGDYATAVSHLERSFTGKKDQLGPGHPSLVGVHSNLGIALEELGRLDEADEQYRAGYELALTVHGEGHPVVARLVGNLANLAHRRGAYEQAQALHRRALDYKTRALGPEHPSRVYSLDGLGLALRELGRLSEAEAVHQQEIEAARASFGSEHPMLGNAWHNLGQAAQRRGRLEVAASAYRTALDLWHSQLGPSHPHVAVASSNLGLVSSELGHHEHAIELASRARTIYVGRVGEAHPETAMLTANLGRVHLAAGDHARAEELLRMAERSLEAGELADHPHLVSILEYRSELNEARGRARDAMDLLSRALQMRSQGIGSGAERARTRFALARLLWSSGERDRAMAMVREAARELEAAGEELPLRAEVEQWLSQHDSTTQAPR